MSFLRATTPTLLLSVSGSMQKLERWTRSLLTTPSSIPSAHKSVLVADLKLADFKQFLANKGLQVEFGGATLRCGEYITVCKIGDSNQKGSTDSQKIVIKGPLCEDKIPISLIHMKT